MWKAEKDDDEVRRVSGRMMLLQPRPKSEKRDASRNATENHCVLVFFAATFFVLVVAAHAFMLGFLLSFVILSPHIHTPSGTFLDRCLVSVV